MEHKSKKYSLLIITCILLIGLSAVAYFNFLETSPEPRQALIQKDMNTNVETPASFSKSTVILIVCIGLVGILGLRRKKAIQANLYLEDNEVAK